MKKYIAPIIEVSIIKTSDVLSWPLEGSPDHGVPPVTPAPARKDWKPVF